MTTYTRPLFLSATLVGLLAMGISGCEKSAEATNSTKTTETTKTETTNTAITDMDIATNVKSALIQDAAVGGLDITVVVSRGDVRLTGFVDNDVQLEQALNVARSVAGVNSVKNELSVKE